MKTPITPQNLPPLRDLTDEERQWSHYNPNTSDLVEFVQAYAREALAAQAACICKSPGALGVVHRADGPCFTYDAQAASVEPVGKIINSGGNTGSLPEHPLLVWLGGVPPVGTELYAVAPPSPANVPGAVEPLTRDDIDKLAKVLEVNSLDEVEPETVYAFTRAIEARFAPQPQAVAASSPSPASVPADVPSAMTVVCKALQDDPEYAWSWHCNIAMSAFDEGIGHYAANKAAARFLDLLAGVDTTKHPGFPPQHPTPSPGQAVMQVGCENIDGTLNIHPETETCSICEPATAVDAVGERIDALKQVDRFFVERLAELGCLSPEAGAVHAMVRAALQAARQPQAQQGGGAISSLGFYKRRCDLLQGWQSKMRDPERTIVCDILANGQTLPQEHAGERYTVPQPQPQQGGGENTARAFIEWCKAQPEDRVPVSIDEALNEFEAALATKEPK